MLEDRSTLDLARKAGGLHLLPANADFYAELIRISAIVAGLPTSEQALFNATDFEWRSWINSGEPMERAPERGGDAIECELVRDFAIHGGVYRAMPVGHPEDGYTLQALFKSILSSKAFDHTPLLAEAMSIATTGLYLSDSALTRAGLSRHSQPISSSEAEELNWPARESARRLEEAVSFTLDEVLAHLASYQLDDTGLKYLSIRPGDPGATYDSRETNPVLRCPILLVEDSLVLVSPSTVVSAIRQALLRCAESHGLTNLLISEYQRTLQRDALAAAYQMDWTGRASSGGYGKPIRMQFDRDKFASLAIDIAEDEVEAESESEGSSAEPLDPPVLELRLTQPLGLDYYVFEERDDENALPAALVQHMTVGEFTLFSDLNRGDNLAMWRVARAYRSLSQISTVLGGCFFDHYAIFRDRDEYYLSDDGPPSFLAIMGAGTNVRRAHATLCDCHYAFHPVSEKFVRVVKLHQQVDEPIYTPPPGQSDEVSLLIELDGPLAWVVTAGRSSAIGAAASDLYFSMADTLAFWLWQFSAAVLSLASMRARPVVTFRLMIRSPERWMVPPKSPAATTGVEVRRISETTVSVILDPDFAFNCLRSDNYAERMLMRDILAVWAACYAVELASETIDSLLDSIAPSGVKRKIVIYGDNDLDIAGADDLPPRRLVEESEYKLLLDEVSQFVREKAGVTLGSLPPDQHGSILNDVVSHLFTTLKDEVAALSLTGLLETLLLQHERLISERRRREIDTAITLACRHDQVQARSEVAEEFVAIDRAAIASRFLIEYVGSCPPAGQEIISDTTYDRLLAVSSELIYRGMMSDSIRYNLSAHTLKVLASGRLEHSGGRYSKAVTGHLKDFYDRYSESSAERFLSRSFDSSPKSDPAASWMEDVEGATRAEFGLSLSEIAGLIHLIAFSSFASESGLGTAEESDLVRHVVAEAGYSEQSVRAVLATLSLEPRADFLLPPRPYKAPDVYPWRFNRGMSYLRRPLLVRRDGTAVVLVWARRALIQSAHYLATLCLDGRLKDVKSSQMKQLQGRLLNRRGDEFNIYVADRIGAISGVVAKPKVKKIGGHKIEFEKGQDLGDIDVFVAVESAKKCYLVEAKAFTVAKTPAEIANESNQLFGELITQSGATGRHLRRCKWVGEHLADALAEVGIEAKPGDVWEVLPILVLDEDLITRRLVDPPFEIITLEAFVSMIQGIAS